MQAPADGGAALGALSGTVELQAQVSSDDSMRAVERFMNAHSP